MSHPVSDSATWLAYFQKNAAPRDPGWQKGATLTPKEKQVIAESLQEFQLGETGEGLHFLRCAHAWSKRSGDHTYPHTLQLFIREEGRHAAELGRYLDLAAIPRISHIWVNTLFRHIRHLAGLELTITVLVTAEILAMVYYSALHDATQCPLLRAICRAILRDEVQHIDFQCQRVSILRARHTRLFNAASWLVYRLFFAFTCLLVWRKHHPVFTAAARSFRTFFHQSHRHLRHARNIMLAPVPHAASGTQVPSLDPSYPGVYNA